MATRAKQEDDDADMRTANLRLKKALRECRELLAQTQALLERVHRMENAAND